MAVNVAEYIEHLGSLVESGQDAAALDLARSHGRCLVATASAEQLDVIAGLLESAQMAVELTQWDASLPRVVAGDGASQR